MARLGGSEASGVTSEGSRAAAGGGVATTVHSTGSVTRAPNADADRMQLYSRGRAAAAGAGAGVGAEVSGSESAGLTGDAAADADVKAFYAASAALQRQRSMQGRGQREG